MSIAIEAKSDVMIVLLETTIEETIEVATEMVSDIKKNVQTVLVSLVHLAQDVMKDVVKTLKGKVEVTTDRNSVEIVEVEIDLLEEKAEMVINLDSIVKLDHSAKTE
jgi:hypothetical protein